jgi:phosphoribosylanthranilate isomerase
MPAALRTRIKFCGLTRLEDALEAARLGVDALGFVLVPGSPRAITAEQARELAGALPPWISVVALFHNAPTEFVRHALQVLRPQLAQFHGEESAADCAQYGWPYLKAVAMRSAAPPDLADAARRYAGAQALLLDGHAPGGMGGSGERFDWDAVASCTKPLILAGGLHAGNVGVAIRRVRPYAVDVSSGIESAPGIKDSGKMEAFVAAVRSADHATAV